MESSIDKQWVRNCLLHHAKRLNAMVDLHYPSSRPPNTSLIRLQLLLRAKRPGQALTTRLRSDRRTQRRRTRHPSYPERAFPHQLTEAAMPLPATHLLPTRPVHVKSNFHREKLQFQVRVRNTAIVPALKATTRPRPVLYPIDVE